MYCFLNSPIVVFAVGLILLDYWKYPFLLGIFFEVFSDFVVGVLSVSLFSALCFLVSEHALLFSFPLPLMF